MAQELHTPISQEEIAHTFDEAPQEVDLSTFCLEDWIAIFFFWLMAGNVILQFVSRYVFNNSYAWTEEIAVYCLVCVVFIGAAMCVRISRHIQVDFIYRYLSPSAARMASSLVDFLRISVVGYMTFLVWRYSSLINEERMTTVDLPKSIVFNLVILGFAIMTFRAIQVALANIRRGYSILERPDMFDGTGV